MAYDRIFNIMKKSKVKNKRSTLIGFIGQGYIGKNYANDFEKRGFDVVRFSLEEPYIKNKDKIKECDIVFIAVPTPTTPKGFSAEIIRKVLSLVGKGKIVVIKSTITPETTKALQKENPDIIVLNSPEFLSEATAAKDASHPFSNIVGISKKDNTHIQAAKVVQSILPYAPFTLTCDSTEAELIKYAHNMSGYVQVILFNLVYDLSHKTKCDWAQIEKAMLADPLVSSRYARPIHKSGRGAGGNCFVKDSVAFMNEYKRVVKDSKGIKVLEALESKNIDLLLQSNKDIPILKGVYGDRIKLKK